MYGVPFKRERCYDNIKITRNAHDSNFCAVNPKFVAIVTEVAGGGAFLVLPLDNVSNFFNCFYTCAPYMPFPILSTKCKVHF